MIEANECGGPSGGGDNGLRPGEGVLSTPREIFSLMARSLLTSASKWARRACISLVEFSKLTIWFVARSKRETLLLFWFDTGNTSFNLAYPSLSSSRRRCSASILCLRVASLRECARFWPNVAPMPSSSSESLRDLPRRGLPDELVGDGVGL